MASRFCQMTHPVPLERAMPLQPGTTLGPYEIQAASWRGTPGSITSGRTASAGCRWDVGALQLECCSSSWPSRRMPSVSLMARMVARPRSSRLITAGRVGGGGPSITPITARPLIRDVDPNPDTSPGSRQRLGWGAKVELPPQLAAATVPTVALEGSPRRHRRWEATPLVRVAPLARTHAPGACRCRRQRRARSRSGLAARRDRRWRRQSSPTGQQRRSWRRPSAP